MKSKIKTDYLSKVKKELFNEIRRESQNKIDRVDDSLEYLIMSVFNFGFTTGYEEGRKRAVEDEDEKRN